MIVRRITYWFARRLQRIDLLVSRRSPSHAVTMGAIGVSLLAGLALALGGALRLPAIWLAVPPLVLARLALHRSVVRRNRPSLQLLFPHEEAYVEVLPPSDIEDEMLHAVGR
ncbi:MAG: hypothetical protein WAT66_05245 [Actinomycetota bacterium]